MPDGASQRIVEGIHQGDCVALMRGLPAGSVDLVFADPPYNLQLQGKLERPEGGTVDGVVESWDQFASFGEYDAFTRAWLGEVRRVLKRDGAVWVLGSYHNIYRVGAVMQDLGFWLLNDVVWRKTNPMPNFRGRRLTSSHETLLWAARGQESRHTYNYQAAKAANGGKQLTADWHFPVCQGRERLKAEGGGKLHPTQKPTALVHQALAISTNEGDLVLDPFCGTATTGAVAQALGRRFVGFEREQRYVDAGRRRLAEAADVRSGETRREPEIGLGTLVAAGLLTVGEELIGADGSRGQVGACGDVLVGTGQCRFTDASGVWDFWSARRNGAVVPLGLIRAIATGR